MPDCINVPDSLALCMNCGMSRTEAAKYALVVHLSKRADFICVVTDEEGPEVTQDPGPDGDPTSDGRQVEVALGGAVQLQCPAATPGGCWSRVDTGGRLQPVGSGPELKLDRVLYQEAGEYRCIAGAATPELDQWRADLDVQLIVTGKHDHYCDLRE